MDRNKAFRFRRGQQGFTLIELGIILALVMLILIGIYAFAREARGRSAVNSEVQDYTSMVEDAKTKYGQQQGDFAGVSAAALAQLGAVANQNKMNGGTMRSAWGTHVFVTSINLFGNADDAIQFTYQVPREWCADFLTGVQSSAAKITVDGTVVKDVTNALPRVNNGALGAACNPDAGGNAPILLASGM